MIGKHLHRGHTLVELVVSMIATGMLISGIGSTLYIATRATDRHASPAAATAEGAEVTRQWLRELPYALWFRAQGGADIAFTVPDRDGDGVKDAIRYTWSGTASDPLRRTENGQTRDELASIQGLQFSYTTENSKTDGSNDLRWLLQNASNTGTQTWTGLNSGQGIGTYFMPSLPGNATHWTVSRAMIHIGQHGTATEVARVQLRMADAQLKPGTLVLDKVVLEQSMPSSPDWFDVGFSESPLIPAGTGACLIVISDSLTAGAGRVTYGTNSTSSPDTHLVTTTNGGSTWSIASNEDLWAEIHGHYYDVHGSRFGSLIATSVSTRIQVTPDEITTTRTQIPFLNRPAAIIP